MENSKIYVTFCDYNRLKIVLDSVKVTGGGSENVVNLLKNKLKRAEVVSPESIPEDVVTMNATPEFRNLETGQLMAYTIVYPGDADIIERKISILTPISSSLFGHASGDSVLADTPSGPLRLMIERIRYQPEAYGIYVS